MPPTTIHVAPKAEDYTSLQDHQSQTPTTFYGAKPVLHYQGDRFRALVSKDQVPKVPIFPQEALDGAPFLEYSIAGSDAVVSQSIREESVAVFVTSENFTVWSEKYNVGLSIPYPAISLHAIQRLDDPADVSQNILGLYMQLELSDPHAVSEDEDLDVLELTLIPPQFSEPDQDVKGIFEAVSACSNLHPDPNSGNDEEMEDGEGDSRIVFEGSVGYEGISGLPGVQQGAANGGLPPPFPGSGGWITAENVSEYFDEEGNWIRDENQDNESLGEGAGRTRTREEMSGDGINGDNNHNSEESKRPRTD